MTDNTIESTIDAVIYDGVRFLESLTRHYGPEKGMELWEAFGSIMGKEVKGKVFFAMLTGQTSGRIKVEANAAQNSNAVAVIKCIRTYTGNGLKEAKDLWDLSKQKVVTIEVSPDKAREFAKDLRALGCLVS